MRIRLVRGALAMGLSLLTLTALAVPAPAATAPGGTERGVQRNPPTWGLDRIDQRTGFDQAYHYETRAEDVTVYVIDSGVDAKHPDFGDRVEAGKDFTGGDGTTDDVNGHGTHLAGIVGGETYGLAKGVKIFPVRVLDAQGGGATEDILAGIDWVTAHAQQPAVAVLGIGGVPNEKLDASVRALAAVMPVTVPAGGESADASGFSPGRVPEALTVGASDALDRISGRSNFGAGVDLFAPGVEVPSPAPGGPGAGVLSGTSIAAAHVAGAAALYRALRPEATPAEVAKGLVDNATYDKLTGLPQDTPNRLLYTVGVASPPIIPED